MQRYPILIGISGKRTFDETSPQADRVMAEAIAARFRTLFEALDQDLPQTPKVVLMGAAFGNIGGQRRHGTDRGLSARRLPRCVGRGGCPTQLGFAP